MCEVYRLTTVFGSAPTDPAAEAFGHDAAEQVMRWQFENMAMSQYPASMRITEPEDAFLALTSYPPGEGADEPQLSRFRQAIADAFRQGGSALEVSKETGLFLSRKPA